MLENVQAAAVDKFNASPEALTLYTEGILGGTDVDGVPNFLWVFQGNEDDRPYRDPEGTGKVAIVFTVNGTWGTNMHNSARMPTLTALVYADRSRSISGNPTVTDSKSKALTVSEAIIKVFHDPGNVNHFWPHGVYVVSCIYASGPSVLPVPNTDGMSRASVAFNLQIA